MPPPIASAADGTLRPGRFRAARAALVATTGALLSVFALGARPAIAGAALWSVFGLLVCTGAILRLLPAAPLGLGDRVREVDGRSWLAPGLVILGAGALLAMILRWSVAGEFWPLWASVVAVPSLFLAILVSAHRLASALGWCAPGAFKSLGFWSVAWCTLVQLPMLGGFGLIDCWEPHYGEVAREILARGDWISLWWAQENWFWSKPILDFWLQALSFLAFGVQTAPDRMIASVAQGLEPRPEWAARVPVFLTALVGQVFFYIGVKSYVGRRAAWFAAIVLVSSPYWFFLTRQSMVDMLYAGPLAAAMGLLLVALRAPPEAAISGSELRLGRVRLGVSVHSVGAAVLLLSTLPQIFYLASRNLGLVWRGPSLGFLLHKDEVFTGSPGNCSLPGNSNCLLDEGASNATLQPILSAVIWLAVLGVLLFGQRREWRIKRLAYLGAWWFTAISFMGKGAPGLVLILFVFVGFVVATGRYVEFKRAELPGLLLILGCVAAPWFVQETARHGSAFIDRLFIHDMVKRAFGHVHDTNGSDDTSFRYYLWQLGYGLFPWSGLVLGFCSLACSSALAGGHRLLGTLTRRRELVVAMLIAALGAFGMFSVTGTKFHHYILPIVPPLAALTGISLDQLWRSAPEPGWLARVGARVPRAPQLAAWVLATVVVLGLVVGQTALLREALPSMSAVVTGGGAFALAAAPVVLVAPRAPEGRRWWLVPTCFGAAALVAFAGRDLVYRAPGDVEGQLRLLHLFTYNYDRPWPSVLDFRAEIGAVAGTAVILTLGLLFESLRRLVLRGWCVLAILWAGWACDVYLVKAAPHWGQRETTAEYYRLRTGPEQPLVGYQLNWHGENFYTGNRMAAFVTSGQKFKDWFKEQRDKGISAIFFVTEHSRLRTLEREVGTELKVEQLTTKALNNKFGLFRVQLNQAPNAPDAKEPEPRPAEPEVPAANPP
jgi:4-amino-4-deoxy-L-arabinose transferase-like glycosyltransferase